MRALLRIGLPLAAAVLAGCNNNPYPSGLTASNTLIYSFEERSPRYLDPTASYANNETPYTFAIYDPPYGYHYLKRPYQLVPKSAAAVVKPRYLDAQGQPLPADAEPDRVAESVYDIPIKPGMRYQMHPAFAMDERGAYRYHAMTREQLGARQRPQDFEHQGTREVIAEDYVYAIKRHATTRIEAPLFAVFAEHVIGLKEYAERIKAEDAKLLAHHPEDAPDKPFLDFRRWPLEGAQVIDRHSYRVRLKGKYPQWDYWMALPFLAPVPWEADAFYAQPGMAAAGLSLNQWPVGSGAFVMETFQRDRLHVLKRNPNYRADPYPCDGSDEDRQAGLLADCGRNMPFVDAMYIPMEKAKEGRREKFKQGWFDMPEIERPEWGIEFRSDMDDSDEVAALYRSRGFQFPVATDATNWYFGFNMLDPVVGRGDTPAQAEKNRKLRHAISIAIDWEEGYGRIFRYKGGVAAHSPLPPALFGSREAQPGYFNPVTHRLVDGKVERRPIEEARALLSEAGYPGGRDAATGKPLVLNYDFQRAVTPEFKAENEWMAKQFAKLGIQLEIRATDFNQYQDKTLKGKHQLFWAGWLADYPDPENFLFLLYGPNAKSKTQGENIANWENAEFDRLFKEMASLDNGPRRQAVIDRMVAIAQQDAPWTWGYIPFSGLAFQPWVGNGKPSIVIRDMAKFYKVDAALRTRLQSEWNAPVHWPLALAALGLAALLFGGWRSWRARERATAMPASARA